MRKCYGHENQIGADTVPLVRVPWWWRTDFTPHLRAGQRATLIVNGVIGSANVWVNGHQVATSSTVTGAYTRFAYDITGLVRPGANAVAIEVDPNDPNTMFTVDDVDWNQIPPDNNTGIQFPVQLAVDGALSDGNAHVLEANAADFSRSTLTVQTDITNNTGQTQLRTTVRDRLQLRHPVPLRHRAPRQVPRLGRPARRRPGDHRLRLERAPDRDPSPHPLAARAPPRPIQVRDHGMAAAVPATSVIRCFMTRPFPHRRRAAAARRRPPPRRDQAPAGPRPPRAARPRRSRSPGGPRP